MSLRTAFQQATAGMNMSALREAADLPSRWRRLVMALLRFCEGRLGFRFPWPTA